jgi:Predicted signal-transduction protein containing cAMP-binding and CBS domains
MPRRVEVRARDVMSSPPVTVGASSTLREASEKMWSEKVGSVIVVDNEGYLLGILTERDVVFAVAKGMFEAHEKKPTVDSVMSKNVVTVNTDSSIAQVAQLMSEFNIKHIVVMSQEGRPVGVISLRDMLDVGFGFLRILGSPD